MSKILLIEPHKLLRQAITLSLFPEHEVEVRENPKGLPMESLANYDLVVVDAAALRASGQLSPDLSRAIQGSRARVVWLEEDGETQGVKRENVVVVKKPIERESFHAALNRFLSPQSSRAVEKSGPSAAAKTKTDTPKKAAKKSRDEGPQQATLQFIDLVDVVEESSAKKERKGSKKPK